MNAYVFIINSHFIRSKKKLPAWTTDCMSETGKRKLKEYGIAPPHSLSDDPSDRAIECPQCISPNTKLISEFGSTACKALYQCQDCKEPLD